MHKIMLIEDDLTLRQQIYENLLQWEYQVAVTENFKDVLTGLIEASPDLILLDINLPYYDGFYWCGKIREVSKIPIIFMSSRDSNMDILMALNKGGDDYVTKPFSMPVLIGKIQAILRRAYQYDVGSNLTETNLLSHNGLVLMPEESTALYGEEKIDLTKNELKILAVLMQKARKIISRNELMTLLWNDDLYVNDNTLTVNINRLRSKLEEAGLPDFIITKKGQGYFIQ